MKRKLLTVDTLAPVVTFVAGPLFWWFVALVVVVVLVVGQ